MGKYGYKDKVPPVSGAMSGILLEQKVQIQHFYHIWTSTKIYMLPVLLVSLVYNCLNFRFAHIGYIHDLL